ncbi:ABC transporter ATP-binding protein [Fulvivirga sp. M361]|uniref:ABC transporter ATP-binding protein n=1 Tax=Fulvivirga sp. M361 TaxID=2594266 RepID=UPI00117A696D|nr:ABC transporter ATP-binding protein [Fulvivirga sp. M361]TRX51306.1 ABC transporter ATP-binding protein [Fulvivirga sp. M361]
MAEGNAPLIELLNVSLQYEENNLVVESLSLAIGLCEKVAIVGETGSGKSTLLRAMAGLESLSNGEIRFNDQHLEGPGEKLIPGHEAIGYLSQHFELPKFTRVEKILTDLYWISSEDASKIYEACKISHLLQRDTRSLSGGEKQRVFLAWLLTRSPQLLLLDEPFSNLDAMHKETIKAVIDNVVDDLGVTCVLVSHDPRDTLSWADRIIVLKNGQEIQSGSPEYLYQMPRGPYVAGLFGRFNRIITDRWSVNGIDVRKKRGDQIIVRPEQLKVSKSQVENSVKGKVLQRAYYGSFDDVEVQLEGETVIARTEVGAFNAGENVFVLLVL